MAAGLQARTDRVNRATSGSAAVTINGARRFQVLDGVGVNINSLSWRGGEARAAIDRLADEMGVTLWRVVFDMEDWEATNDNDDPMMADQAYYTALYSNAKFQNLWGTLHYLNQRGVTSGISISFMGRVPPWMGASVITARERRRVGRDDGHVRRVCARRRARAVRDARPAQRA